MVQMSMLQDEYGKTPLHWAIIKKSFKISKLLIEKGAKLDIKDKNGQTPLHLSTMIKSLKIVKLLIKKGANINVQDEDGKTPLHLSVKYKHLKIVKFLVEKDADVNDKDKDGQTPLSLSFLNKSYTITEFLFLNLTDFDVDDEYINEIFLHFINLSNLTVVKHMINNGFPVNKFICGSFAPLHYAASSENIFIIKWLLTIDDIIIDIEDKFGNTPLYRALDVGHIEYANMLIDKGADIHYNDLIINLIDEFYVFDKNTKTIFNKIID